MKCISSKFTLGEDNMSLENRVTDILGSFYPIIQGAMRKITLGEMAAAVSNCGGFGQIAASGLTNDELRSELKRARELTDRPVGVNIPIYRPNAFDALEISIEMGVKTVTTSAGNPAKMMERIREAGLRVVHKVSNESMARKAQTAGVDAVVVTGFEAGGHIGRNDVSTLCMVPQLVDVLDIPVVAAGGIGDARGLVAAFALGAEGVEMGTRFLATSECSVPSFFKERVCSASSDETFILGKKEMPIRVLRNRMTEQLDEMGEAGASEFLGRSGDSTYVTEGGNTENATMPCGQSVGVVRRIEGLSEVFVELIRDAEEVSKGLGRFFGGGER
jgi:enoyl-[acyl-carrier protein] reductase II